MVSAVWVDATLKRFIHSSLVIAVTWKVETEKQNHFITSLQVPSACVYVSLRHLVHGDDVQAHISDILWLWEYVEIILCWSPVSVQRTHHTLKHLAIRVHFISKNSVVGFMGCLALMAIVNAVVERTKAKIHIFSAYIVCRYSRLSFAK